MLKSLETEKMEQFVNQIRTTKFNFYLKKLSSTPNTIRLNAAWTSNIFHINWAASTIILQLSKQRLAIPNTGYWVLRYLVLIWVLINTENNTQYRNARQYPIPVNTKYRNTGQYRIPINTQYPSIPTFIFQFFSNSNNHFFV